MYPQVVQFATRERLADQLTCEYELARRARAHRRSRSKQKPRTRTAWFSRMLRRSGAGARTQTAQTEEI
jgi:hypothetical protein